MLAARETRDTLFALAELSFHHAEQAGKNEHYLAAAIYAYAFLLPEDGTPQPDPLDPRRRLAADIYNLGWFEAWIRRMAKKSCFARENTTCLLASWT